jgi:hypothetical protein
MTERFRNGGANWWIAEPNRDRSEDRVANRRGYDSGAELAAYLKRHDLAQARATSCSTASNATLLPFDAAPQWSLRSLAKSLR